MAAFAAEPEAGALQIEGRMIDRPHLKLAQRLLGIET
jgi:citrate lyase subunit beta/citryl-CoA lyase